MAFLITYPKQDVSEALRQRLAATAPTLYLPLRKFQPLSLSDTAIAKIQASHFLILTSPVTVNLYLEKLRSLNPTAVLLVLSQKMAVKLKAAGVDAVWQATAENARSLADLVTPTIEREACLLRGDRSVIQTFLPSTVKQVMVYQNVWDQQAQQAAMAQLVGKQFTKVLVTSPSSFQRLARLMADLPTVFTKVTYYTLGQTTAKAIPSKNVVVAKGPGVLQNAIMQMCEDK
jgi:uroporphyrinogen-III synthase